MTPMDSASTQTSPSAEVMVGLELGLAAAAVAVAWPIGYSPWIGMGWTERTVGDQLSAMLVGVAAARRLAPSQRSPISAASERK